MLEKSCIDFSMHNVCEPQSWLSSKNMQDEDLPCCDLKIAIQLVTVLFEDIQTFDNNFLHAPNLPKLSMEMNKSS